MLRPELEGAERAERDGALLREGAEREGAEREGAEREGAEREGAEREGAEREGALRDWELRDWELREGAEREGALRDWELLREGAERPPELPPRRWAKASGTPRSRRVKRTVRVVFIGRLFIGGPPRGQGHTPQGSQMGCRTRAGKARCGN